MDKKEILANLYAIKAGMSAISLEKDKLDAKQKDVDVRQNAWKDNLKKQDDLEDLILRDDNRIKNSNNTIESAKKTLSNQKSGIKENEKNSNNAAAEVWKKASPSIFICLMLIIGGIVMIIDYVKKMIGTGVDIEENMFTLVIGSTLIAIAFIVLIVTCQKASKDSNQIKKSGNNYQSQQMSMAKSNYNSVVTAQQDAIKIANNDKENHKNQLVVLQNELPNLEARLSSAKQAYTMVEEVVLPVSNAIYEAMLNKYGDFLDEREWCIVDLLIYYFETGRADTLKEALLHADQQRALQKIVEAVLMANENICQTFDRSLRNLGDRLTLSIGMVQTELMVQTDRIVGSNIQTAKAITRSQEQLASEIKSSMASVSSAISSSVDSLQNTMTTNANAQTELIKKMRQDSNSLAQNVRYMTTKTYGSAM